MNKWVLYRMSSALTAVPLALCTGCSESVGPDDVADARQDAAEERRETQEARRDAAEAVREEEKEAAAARHEAMRPIIPPDKVEAAREEEREAREARQDAMSRVREEEKETREAEQNVAETEAKLSARRERDRYLDEVNVTLKTVDQRIETLKTQRDSTEDEALKKRLDDRISQLEKERDTVKEELDQVESAELLKWESERNDVQAALESLKRDLNSPE